MVHVENISKAEKNGTLENEERRRSRIMFLFVVNVCALVMSHMSLSIYTYGVLRTIERRFSLNSSKTGLLHSCNDIFQICLVVFIGYFGQRYNKPRIICGTVMFSAIAGFLMASPYFIFPQDDHLRVHRTSHNSTSVNNIHNHFAGHKPFNAENLTSNTTATRYVTHPTLPPSVEKHNPHETPTDQGDDKTHLCALGNNTDHLGDENCENLNGDQTHPAFYVFVLAQLIVGIGSSAGYALSIAYIDENSPKTKAAIYLGAFMGTFSFAPVSGFMLATLCLKFPENLFSDENMDPSDPSFIGCWWLGYLVCGTLVATFALPLWWYPKKFGSHDGMETADIEKGFLNQFAGIPKAGLSLIKNKLYICYLFQFICGAFTIYGVLLNLVRYIEVHFNMTAAEGSIIAGFATAVTGLLGNISGGFLVSRFKFRTIDGIRLVLFCSCVFACGNVILMNLACPQVEMDMNYDPKLDMNTAINDCNKPCRCTTNRVDYRPICGSNNVSYFSPCIAGCSESVNDSFIICKCLKRQTPQKVSMSNLEYFEGSASKGYCIPACNLLMPFIISVCVMCFATALAKVSNTLISLRIVKDDERSFALGMNSFFINLLGFIPAPLILGYLIDKSCILWQVTCQTVGACLVFDVARLRFSIFGSSLFMEIVSFTFNFLIFLSLRKTSLASAMLTHEQKDLKTNREYTKVSIDDRSKTKDLDVTDGVATRESSAQF